jgi:hypothetical protein
MPADEYPPLLHFSTEPLVPSEGQTAVLTMAADGLSYQVTIVTGLTQNHEILCSVPNLAVYEAAEEAIGYMRERGYVLLGYWRASTVMPGAYVVPVRRADAA